MAFTAKQSARMSDLALDAETTKKQVRDFVNTLIKTGSITEADAGDIKRILSDKDMCAEDALDELRSLENILADAANSNPEKLVETEDQNENEESPAAGPSLLAGLCSQITDPIIPEVPAPAAKPVPEKTGKTIEPNREEQNGLKRPSKGSTCALIWDTCDRISAEGATCTSAQLFAACNGLNDCTLRTQYARWRAFNGITGRLPGQTKVAKVPAEFQDVIDNLSARIAEDKTDVLASLQAVKTPDALVTWMAANFINF